MTTDLATVLQYRVPGLSVSRLPPDLRRDRTAPAWQRFAGRVAGRLKPGELAVMPTGDAPGYGSVLVILNDGEARSLSLLLTPSDALAIIDRLAGSCETCVRPPRVR